MVDGVVKYMINIGNITVNLFFVSIALGLGFVILIVKLIVKWFLKKIKIDKKFVIELRTGVGALKGHYVSIGITNIGNEKLWIDKIVILTRDDDYFEIRCNKRLDLQQKEFFEYRYSESFPTYSVSCCSANKYFVFYNDKIYMIECGKKAKHRIIEIQKYNSYIENKKKISFATYSMTFTNENKEKEEIIFNRNMIYILQFFHKTDIESEWQFYCFATIDCNGNFMAYDKLLLSKNGKPFGAGSIENSILKYRDKIVGFIRDNWIDTSVNDIGWIDYTTTPEGDVLAGIAEKI